MSEFLPSLSQLKSQARMLRAALADHGTSINHGGALELVAHQYGYRDWNTLHAQCSEGRPISSIRLGERVKGTYLGHEISAIVIGLKSLAENRCVRITVKFDKAVDVVRSSSFSNLRSRVTCVLNQDARTLEATSDGVPHMQLELI